MPTAVKRNGRNRTSCHSEAAAAGRKALGVDSEIKAGNLARLKRIEGQIRGISKMVEDDRYCPDILNQVAAVQEALRGVARELVRNHLTHCVPTAVKRGTADGMADELAEIFHELTK